MKVKSQTKLPLWWLLVLAPSGYLLTLLFHRFASGTQQLLGIGQYRIYSLLVYTLATAVAVALYWLLLKRKGLNFKAAGYRGRLTWKSVWAVLAAVAITSFAIYPLLSWGLGSLNIPMYWTSGEVAPIAQSSGQDLLLGFFVAVVLAPLTEDTIFRGYVCQMLNDRAGKWAAILISSLLFALLHIQFFGPGLAIWIFFFGIASAYLYCKYDSIYPSLLFHALNNLWAYVLVPLFFA